MTDVYAVDSKGGKIPVTLIHTTIHSSSIDEGNNQTLQPKGVILDGKIVMFDDYFDTYQFTHPQSGEVYTVSI